MDPLPQLKGDIKALLVQNLMLTTPAQDLADDLPLFGADGLGLDSVDALQLVVALDKTYGLKIPDADAARITLANVNSIAQAVAALPSAAPREEPGGSPQSPQEA